jgi:hypothetical protein
MSYTTGGIGQSATMTTSNSSEQVLFTYGVNTNSSGRFTFEATARKLSNGHTKIFFIRALFERYNGGNVSVAKEVLPAIVLSGNALELLLVTADVVASGSDVQVKIKGLSMTDFEWEGAINGTELYEA